MVNCKAVKKAAQDWFFRGIRDTIYSKKKKSTGINPITDWMHFNFKT